MSPQGRQNVERLGRADQTVGVSPAKIPAFLAVGLEGPMRGPVELVVPNLLQGVADFDEGLLAPLNLDLAVF